METVIGAPCGPDIYTFGLSAMAVFQTVALAYVAQRWRGVPKNGE